MRRRCEGEAVSADMLFTELLDQLRTSAGKPVGAKPKGLGKRRNFGFGITTPTRRFVTSSAIARISWATLRGESFCCVFSLDLLADRVQVRFGEAVVEVQVVRNRPRHRRGGFGG